MSHVIDAHGGIEVAGESDALSAGAARLADGVCVMIARYAALPAGVVEWPEGAGDLSVQAGHMAKFVDRAR